MFGTCPIAAARGCANGLTGACKPLAWAERHILLRFSMAVARCCSVEGVGDLTWCCAVCGKDQHLEAAQGA
jgi:hypothetical protein